MKYLTAGVIFLVVGGMIGGYAFFLLWALGTAGVSLWVVIFISFVFFAVLMGLVVAFFARIKEIGKEDTHDYRNY
ncbi:MAG: hypothetical protein N2314_00640 [Brevinematales bacterium]|nr:hypothetical protein [Brevinematales bacterium]